MLIRKAWFRVSCIALLLAVVNLVALDSADYAELRASLLGVLPSLSLLFGLTVGLAMTILTTFVFGLRVKAWEQVRRVRQLLGAFSAEVERGGDADLKRLYEDHASALWSLGFTDLPYLHELTSWAHGIPAALAQIEDEGRRIAITRRFLLPLEDEMNALGQLYVRILVLPLHVATLRGAFGFILFAMATVLCGKLLPAGVASDYLLANLAAVACGCAILEFLYVSSYLLQEATDELFEEEEDSADEGVDGA